MPLRAGSVGERQSACPGCSGRFEVVWARPTVCRPLRALGARRRPHSRQRFSSSWRRRFGALTGARQHNQLAMGVIMPLIRFRFRCDCRRPLCALREFQAIVLAQWCTGARSRGRADARRRDTNDKPATTTTTTGESVFVSVGNELSREGETLLSRGQLLTGRPSCRLSGPQTRRKVPLMTIAKRQSNTACLSLSSLSVCLFV